MPLIKALQTCDKLLFLVVNPGFYCLVISCTHVWHFIHLTLLIFPQQNKDFFHRNSPNSCIFWQNAFSQRPIVKAGVNVCQETWIFSLYHHLAVWLWAIQFLLLWLNFLVGKMESVGSKVSGSFQLPNLLMLSWLRITFWTTPNYFFFLKFPSENNMHSASTSHFALALADIYS